MVKTLAGSYNASGLQLYGALARQPGNIVLSPYSIGTALAMAYSGARGDTEKEMAAALKLEGPPGSVDAANAGLLKVLPSAALIAANALVLPKGGPGVADTYAAALRASYGAQVLKADGAADINAWVADKTAGKIAQIIDELPSGPVLINAVYLKAAWAWPFAVSATKNGDFHLTAGTRVSVPLMRQEADLALVERTGYRAIKLDYAERSLSLVVVLPNEVEGLNGVTDRLNAGELTSLVADLGKAKIELVDLSLPRFKASFTADLVPPLQAAGVRLAFSDAADFSGIAGDGAKAGSFKIVGVRHRALIEVDEHGTEAAATTAVSAGAVSAPIPRQPVAFMVDRPFLFLVVDNASGAVLFQGRIADPSRRAS